MLFISGCAANPVPTNTENPTPSYPETETADSIEEFTIGLEKSIRTEWIRERSSSAEITYSINDIDVNRTDNGYRVRITYAVSWTDGDSVTDARFVAAYYVTNGTARRTVTDTGEPADPREGQIVFEAGTPTPTANLLPF